MQKDEIKEIIKNKKITNFNYDIYEKQLLDYITNLQEENQILEINNKTLHEISVSLDSQLSDRSKQLQDYKTRNEKAIEYIEKNSEKVELNFVGFPDSIVSFKGSMSTLLKILKGKSDE